MIDTWQYQVRVYHFFIYVVHTIPCSNICSESILIKGQPEPWRFRSRMSLTQDERQFYIIDKGAILARADALPVF